MKSRNWLLCLGIVGWLVVPSRGAEPPAAEAPADPVFGMDRVWKFHLKISAENWQEMLPTKGLNLFGSPEFADRDEAAAREKAAAEEPVERRGGFKFDFRYVRGDLEVDGQTYADVGVRFKGNSSYGLVAQTPKRPFKLDFDRYVEGQTFHGQKMLNLTNNALEPSQLRESLAYAAFRAGGVPAPRTAFVELHLTVPGQFDNQFVGLYTLIEQVDRTFLKRHFDSSKGMLLKPEGFQGLPYLGDRWEPYEQFYRPKNDPDLPSRQRLIDLTRLLAYATDDEFNGSLDRLMDVDNFLRYLAVCSLSVNLDSFIGFGHNYYLYLNPEDNRFVWIPWDLNGTFGAMGLGGPNERQLQWSIAAPYIGTNRLAERVLAVPAWRELYRKHIRHLIDTACQPEVLNPLVDRMQSAVQEVIDREAELPKPELPAVWKLMMAMGDKPPGVKDFVSRRVASMRAQLDEQQPGKELSLAMLPTPQRDAVSRLIARPLFRAVDSDKNRSLSVDEITEALRRLQTTAVGEQETAVEERQLAVGIVRVFPKPSGLFARLAPAPPPQPPGFGAGQLLAGYLTHLAQGRPFSTDLWPEVAGRLVARGDTNGDGALDETEVIAGLNWLPPPTMAFDPAAEPAKPQTKPATETPRTP